MMNLFKNNVRAKEMAKGLGVHATPAVGLSLVSSTHTGQLTATYSCPSWGIQCLLSLGAPALLHILTHAHNDKLIFKLMLWGIAPAWHPASQFSAGTSMSSKAVFQKDFHYSASVADHDVLLWR